MNPHINIDRYTVAVDYWSNSPSEKGTTMSLVIEKALNAVDEADKAVPPSAEVQAEAEAKGDDASIPKNIRPKAPKAKAPKAKAAKGSTKAKPAKPRGTGNGSGPAVRLTDAWMSSKRKDVKVKDEVTVPGGVVITVIGRWTKHKGDQLVPMVTGRIVSGAPGGKKKGDRHNAAAAEVTHVK
jgi:hypothetical protein